MLKKWMTGLLAGVGLCMLIPSLAYAEDSYEYTAGSSLRQEQENYDSEEMPMLNIGGAGQWIQNSKGWWYSYNDGTWPKEAWCKIGSKWYYFDSNGYWVDNNTKEAGTLKGVDVSAWNAVVDWDQLKSEGIQFAFIRIGYGTKTVDKYFNRNMTEAARVGIPVGVYYYSLAKSDAQSREDAAFVIDALKGYKVSYPVVIDMEDEDTQGSLTTAQRSSITKVFCDEVRAAGYTPMLYCNEYWYKTKLDASKIGDVEMWIARWSYTFDESIPRDIWQSSVGVVNGIDGYADIDFGYTDYSKIITPRTQAISGYTSGGQWMKDSTGWKFKLGDGTMAKSCWKLIGGKWYWFKADGYMATGWVEVSGKTYYLTSSGAMHTGWISMNNTWYYLKPEGDMAVGWVKVGGYWYYMDPSSGKMQTGWKEIGGTWYYMSSSGVMQTGWVKSGTTWYYLTSTGAMAIKTWIGNYYVDANGAMVTSAYIKNGSKYYWVNSTGKYTKTYAEKDTAGYHIYEQSTGQKIQ